jgi:hypothetical protein
MRRILLEEDSVLRPWPLSHPVDPWALAPSAPQFRLESVRLGDSGVEEFEEVCSFILAFSGLPTNRQIEIETSGDARSSTSMHRAPAGRDDYVRGSTRNVMFRPGLLL